ncbi:hypothetical protein CPT34_10555 [Rhizobium sophoriradicis]|uniref:Uncharacterized protein n=1 Tax=Rhizobium sophoriradicis TaxID=1535245 RepID=A0A2A5KVX4_9HYPH|nr:hypothetical protein CPT34_10555 [Rhizobium sophoriradicis]
MTDEFLQRRASFQTRKGRCNTLNCCIILSLNRFRSKELCSRSGRSSTCRACRLRGGAAKLPARYL